MEGIPREIIRIIFEFMGQDGRKLAMTSKEMMKIMFGGDFPQMIEGFSVRFAKNRCIVCRDKLSLFPMRKFCEECSNCWSCDNCNKRFKRPTEPYYVYFPVYPGWGEYCYECKNKMIEMICEKCGRAHNFYGIELAKRKCWSPKHTRCI
jgi:hypothetical protein